MLTPDALRELFLAFPGVEEGTSYGTPAFRVRKKLLARMHQDEDAVVLRVRDLDHREALLAAHPRAFYITPHYEGEAWVLARLAGARPSAVREVFEESWRAAASKRQLRELEEGC